MRAHDNMYGETCVAGSDYHFKGIEPLLLITDIFHCLKIPLSIEVWNPDG